MGSVSMLFGERFWDMVCGQPFPPFQCVVGGCPDLGFREFQYERDWPWMMYLPVFNGSLLFFLFEVRVHPRHVPERPPESPMPSFASSLRAPPCRVHSSRSV